MDKIKCLKFPKIEQYRNVVSAINRSYSYVGLDENGDAIYDQLKPKPTIKFKGTVKLHGTNAGISYNDKFGVWTQSRNNSFDLDTNADSHMGFSFFVKSNMDYWETEFKDFAYIHDIDTTKFCISIFGEWAGKGIQKGVGISEIEKSFFIFGIKVSNPDDEDFVSQWYDYSNIHAPELKVYNMTDFPTWEIEIDFNEPSRISNKLSELTMAIEEECPVAKHFGKSGIGEGIVWETNYNGTNHRFKVKGEKHSVSKVKTLAPVDVEKLDSVNEFVEYAMTRNRFNQALGEVFNSPVEYDVKKTGDLLRWLINDIMNEEIDVMTENGLTPKDTNKYISVKAKNMFFAELQNV